MFEPILAENGLYRRGTFACCVKFHSMDSYDRDPFDPRLSELFAESRRDERLQERPDRVKPRHWRFLRHWLNASSSSSSSMSSRWSLGSVNEKVALSESLVLLSSSSQEGHSIDGNAIVSSTCSDAFMKSPISKDPDVKRDRVRFKGAERWVSALSQPVDGLFRDRCSPFSMLIRAFVAKSLLIWIIVNLWLEIALFSWWSVLINPFSENYETSGDLISLLRWWDNGRGGVVGRMQNWEPWLEDLHSLASSLLT